MEFKFKNKSGQGKIYDPIFYTKKILSENDNVKIYIGTDSQTFSNKTVFIISICYHIGNSGVKGIFSKIITEKYKNNVNKLYKEIEMTYELVKLFSENNIDIYQIDLDLNTNPESFSNKIIPYGEGLFKSMGYRVGLKPGFQIATKMSDSFLKK